MPAAVVLLRRVVHGLDIHSAVQLTDSTIAKIRQASALAPLHNPPGLQGIEAAMKVFGGVPQVGWGCFCIIVCCRRGSSEVCRAATSAFSSPMQIRKVLMRFTGAANPCAPEVSGGGVSDGHMCLRPAVYSAWSCSSRVRTAAAVPTPTLSSLYLNVPYLYCCWCCHILDRLVCLAERSTKRSPTPRLLSL